MREREGQRDGGTERDRVCGDVEEKEVVSCKAGVSVCSSDEEVWGGERENKTSEDL